jgi:NAD(P)-dependent dehydrogenase (short-subunit alcohol dehydrogenase family)
MGKLYCQHRFNRRPCRSTFQFSFLRIKSALATITRNTAFAAMRTKIRINQLEFGWMSSDGEDGIQREYHGAADGWLEKAAAKRPFGRRLAPAQVAEAVNFLVSDDSGMMTGAVIDFDHCAYRYAPPSPASKISV